MEFNFLIVCEIFFKLKFSKFIQDIRTLESFGKFLLFIVYMGLHLVEIITFSQYHIMVRLAKIMKFDTFLENKVF